MMETDQPYPETEAVQQENPDLYVSYSYTTATSTGLGHAVVHNVPPVRDHETLLKVAQSLLDKNEWKTCIILNWRRFEE